MIDSKTVHLIGFASDLASAHPNDGSGPKVLMHSPYLMVLGKKGINYQWDAMIDPGHFDENRKEKIIIEQCQTLAAHACQATSQKQFFTVIGGDHSCAIGTWSGVHHAVKDQGDLGLIWVDAHMDSHTPDTSQTGNIHGMPLACLLGYGMPALKNIYNAVPKIKPEHLCLIGVRSYEDGEAKLLKDLNVRIYYMEEVQQRGLDVVMNEAIAIVKKGTVGFGISIDIDSIDPSDAPGTGVAESNGLVAKELRQALEIVAQEPQLLGAEIVEFDPNYDQDQKTEKLIPHLIATLALGKRYHDFFKS